MKKQPTYYKYTPKKAKLFIELFPKKMCNISATCVGIGINRQTYYNWIDKLDGFQEAVDIAEEELFDMIESKIYSKAVVDGDNTMLIHVSRAKMAKRGYQETIKTEVGVNPFMELMKRASQKKKKAEE